MPKPAATAVAVDEIPLAASELFVVKPEKTEQYSIPLTYRKMENLHIVFWLFKDVAWCMVWKPLAVVMIIPTLVISTVIAWNTRKMMSELCHNLAITLWISANSYWMISEFVHIDTIPLFGEFTFKHLALIPFFLGIIVLFYYYILYKPKQITSIKPVND